MIKWVSGLALLGLGLAPLALGVGIATATGEPSQGLNGQVLGGILTVLGMVQVIRWRPAARGHD